MRFYNFPAEGEMQCDVRLFATELIYNEIEDTALKQLFDASKIPGIIAVIGMPDLHQGYGLPIGGIMVSRLNDGIISPGAVGFDINCGVRLMTTQLEFSDIQKNLEKIMRKTQIKIPAGVGEERENNFNKNEFKKIVTHGVPYLVNEKGIGNKNDIDSCEDNGFIKGADADAVPEKAIERAFNQLATLGSGNHFLELQRVKEVYAEDCGLFEGQLVFMIHTGSRAFGHQIAKHYSNIAKKSGVATPTKNLASFKIDSEGGINYKKAMAAAANFAFANRHLIAHKLRHIIKEFYPKESFDLFYDITHNIAKKELYQGEEVLVHRKGACKLAKEDIALIPGSMGTFSYLIKAQNSKANELSYYSTAHGAGRKMSRSQAKKDISQKDHFNSMGTVKLFHSSRDSILDESPLAYKDINSVIDALEKTDLAKAAAKFEPLAVIKG
ncbi:RtcB family protein [Halanaerobium hydrogeniformans]|uniref:tRNA-splicing ligase RtcB n=1 Tax=Halanaerobium hydrogeniformans TaxID=656519 RepID=E4RIS3_HALHG|nr:RtcB family protein [Halanaerobium hydrogeniformans]ADQ15143.1 protein of unknown function UPF0027 [Halanaerobium hydrogeniformans]